MTLPKFTGDPVLTVRALACITIIWTHIYPSIPERIAGNLLTPLFHPNASAAVFIFYFISAYGIGYRFASGKYTYSARSILGYYVNRILRIVPLYFWSNATENFWLYARENRIE